MSPSSSFAPPPGGEPGSTRLDRLRARLAEHGVDAFVTAYGANRRYMSGFTGSAGMAVVLPSAAVLLVDGRYTEQARQQAPGWDVRQVDAFYEALAEVLAEAGVRRCGFEEQRVSYYGWRQLQEKAGAVEWVPLAPTVERLRAVKEPHELAAMRRAIALADRAFTYILDELQPGVSERDVALKLEVFMRREGAEAVSFPPIVASGPNAALPHARPTRRALQPGDVVILDFGCVVDGYCSDLTRTVFLGPAGDRGREIYDLVLRAQEAGLDALRPGAVGRDVDGAAREVIKGAGYGSRFGHGLGHGVGLEVHEDIPRLSQRSETVLAAGMVTSVEPGIYIPGWGGVRIEDLAVVTEDGCQVLSAAPKELMELPV